MKNKGILAIFLVFVICFIAVSQVSAVDVASNDVKDFTWLNDTIQNNDYVNLNNDVVLADAEADDFQYGIYINKSIIIDGNGHKIDANNVGNIFIIEEGNTVVLNNITFINSGNSAIVNYGNLTVNDCLFANNTAVGYMMGGAGYGGAINNIGNLNINSTAFINNKAGFGGAIKNEGTTSIYYGYFVNNTAGAAGAIYNKGSLTIFDSEFYYNNVTGFANFPVSANGGAIGCTGNSLTKIINTIFYANNAKLGAAIHNDEDGNLFVEDCIFYFNQATEGGAIYNNNLMHVTNSIFSLNYADYGGSIYNSGQAIIFYNEFKFNGAIYGGAIVNAHNAVISNNIFNYNDASNHSDDISNYCGNISLIANIASYEDYATISNYNGTIVSPTYVLIDNRNIIKIGESVEIEAYLCDDYGNLIYDPRGLELYANGELISGNFSSNETGLYVITGLYPYSVEEKQICYPGYVKVVLYEEGTFDELQYLIDNTEENGVLNITKDFVSNGNYVYINSNITIYGNGYTLDAKELSGIFYIGDGVSVNIYDLNFINSRRSAIVNNGFVNLTSCNFKDNRDTSTLTGGAGYGGAIRNYNNLKLILCTFVHNTATYGGVIYNDGDLTISSSGSFINNTAATGGAIYNNRGNINMMNVNFENNNANGYYGSYIGKGLGGAIYFKEGILNIVNTYFVNNYAQTYGSAIYTYNDNFTTMPIVNIIDSYFMNNVAGVNSALFTDARNVNVSAVVNINNCMFSNNSLGGSTGRNAAAIYLFKAANSVVVNSLFENNDAAHSCGALYIEGDNITVDGCTFNGNYASQYGGAIVVLNSNNVFIRDSKFKNNYGLYGGSIYAEGNGYVVIKNCSFADNSAVDGGAIYNNITNMYVDNCLFNNNNAANGGAIYSVSNLSVKDSLFNDNKADGFYGSYIGKGFGGAIYFKDGILNVLNTTFVNNYAKTYGGTIYAYSDNSTTTSIVNLINSTFIGNIAGIDAGVLFTDANNTNISAILNIDNCLFSNNLVNDTGYNAGAIYLSGAKGTIEDSIFENNDASHSCGALYIDTSSIVVDGCTFDGNYASQYGGAIVVIYSNNVTIINSEFNNNYGLYGGSIYAEGKGSVFVQNCSFADNSAVDGGAIYNNITNMYVDNCLFDNNNAANGGAIYSVSNLFVRDSLFNDNDADGFYGSYIGKGYGGAIFNKGLSMVYNNTFINNTAVDYGGAIENRFVAYIGLNKFLDNEAVNASSAIGNGNGTIYLKNNTVSGIGINNNGFIASETNIVVGNNDTIGFNESIKLNAFIYDDNGNIIHDPRGIPFNVNGTIIVGTLESPAIFCSNKTGYYEVSVNYDYSNSTLQEVINGSITVVDSYKIDIEDLRKYYGGSERLEAVLTKNGEALVGETVALTINGKTYYIVTDSEGKVSLGINLMPGYYTAEASYGNLTEEAEVEILNTIVAEDITKMFHNDTHYVAYFCDSEGNALVNANVIFNINGVFYNRVTDEEGEAILAINLNAGEYIITAYNSVTGECFSSKIVVLPTLVANDVIKMKGGKAQYIVTAYDDHGDRLANADITININGVQYTRTTDSNGVARLNINLDVGQYIATASYNGFYTSNIITVVGI